MPQIARKEIERAVMGSACPEGHKAQFVESLSQVQGLNIGRIVQIVQIVSQYAVKYGPQIWADIQVLIALFTNNPPGPAPAPGPIPAQRGAENQNPRDLIQAASRSGKVMAIALAIIVIAFLMILWGGKTLAGERLPQNMLALPQNMVSCDCPCGPNCACGPNCQCSSEEFAVLYDDQMERGYVEMLDPFQQTPQRLQQNLAATGPAVAAPAVAAPTFHYETRLRCTANGCVPYTVTVMDSPQAGRTAAVAYQQQGVTNYQQTFAADGGDCASFSAASGPSTFAARRGLFHRVREWRSARHARRGMFACCG